MGPLTPELASLATLGTISAYSWQPFVNSPPIWDYWYLLLIPLTVGVAIVYKSLKVPHMRDLPRDAAITSLWIFLGLVIAGAILAGLTRAVWQ
jgi:hypothetical protein